MSSGMGALLGSGAAIPSTDGLTEPRSTNGERTTIEGGPGAAATAADAAQITTAKSMVRREVIA